MDNIQEPPPSYEFITRELMKLSDQPPPYEAHVDKQRGVNSTQNGRGITDINILRVEYEATRIQPERMIIVSLVTTLVCLLLCSWMCSLGALYLSHEALKSKHNGEHKRERTLVRYVTVLNIFSLASGVVILITMIIVMVDLPKLH